MSITIETELRNSIVINILTDAVIFERTLNGVNQLMKAFDPMQEDWEASDHYNSYCNAYPLMGYTYRFKDEEVLDMFRDAFWEHYNRDSEVEPSKRMTAERLAQHIFVDWLAIQKKLEKSKLITSN